MPPRISLLSFIPRLELGFRDIVLVLVGVLAEADRTQQPIILIMLLESFPNGISTTFAEIPPMGELLRHVRFTILTFSFHSLVTTQPLSS